MTLERRHDRRSRVKARRRSSDTPTSTTEKADLVTYVAGMGLPCRLLAVAPGVGPLRFR